MVLLCDWLEGIPANCGMLLRLEGECQVASLDLLLIVHQWHEESRGPHPRPHLHSTNSVMVKLSCLHSPDKLFNTNSSNG